jgi:ABC-type multidrug transport system ATPase subunit
MGINLQNIEKKFDGKSVLKDISIQIDFNQVYCILGSNGAGKSTLINIMCDLLKPDSGFLDFNKKTYQLDSLYIKQNTGLLSQYNTLIEELNTFDFLNFIGMIYKMNSNEILSQIEKLTSFKTHQNLFIRYEKKSKLMHCLYSQAKLFILRRTFRKLRSSNFRFSMQFNKLI